MDLRLRRDPACTTYLSLGITGLRKVVDVARGDGWTFQGKMVEGEKNRVRDRLHRSTTAKDGPDDGRGASQTQTEQPETQRVTGRPRENRILKRKVLRNVKLPQKGQKAKRFR